MRRLQRSLSALPTISGLIVAVELFARKDLRGDEFGSAILDHTPTPAEFPLKPGFVVYDVSDAGFIRALSDCEYTPHSRQSLSPQWSGRINEFGLSLSIDGALDCCGISDSRIPEHAPFRVYGIHVVGEGNGYLDASTRIRNDGLTRSPRIESHPGLQFRRLPAGPLHRRRAAPLNRSFRSGK